MLNVSRLGLAPTPGLGGGNAPIVLSARLSLPHINGAAASSAAAAAAANGAGAGVTTAAHPADSTAAPSASRVLVSQASASSSSSAAPLSPPVQPRISIPIRSRMSTCGSMDAGSASSSQSAPTSAVGPLSPPPAIAASVSPSPPSAALPISIAIRRRSGAVVTAASSSSGPTSPQQGQGGAGASSVAAPVAAEPVPAVPAMVVGAAAPFSQLFASPASAAAAPASGPAPLPSDPVVSDSSFSSSATAAAADRLSNRRRSQSRLSRISIDTTLRVHETIVTAAPGGAQITAIPSPLAAAAAAASSNHVAAAPAAASSSSSDVLTISRDDPPPLPAFPYPVAPASARSYASARSGSPTPNSAGVGNTGGGGRQVQPQSARASQHAASLSSARRSSYASPPPLQSQASLALPGSDTNSRRTSLLPPHPTVPDLHALLGTFSASNSSMMLGVAAALRTMGSSNDESKPSCAECEREPATVRCDDCDRNYCTACNRATHASRSMRNHTRTALADTAPSSAAPSEPQPQPQQSLSSSPPTPSPRPPSDPNTPRLVGQGGHGRMISRASLGGTALAPPAVPAMAPASAPVRPSLLQARQSGDSDSSDDDDGDASVLASVAACPDAALCDQCHSSLAVVYCLECDSNLDSGCNARIHKARAMARHRQVHVDRRAEVIRQIEDAAEKAAQLEAAVAADDEDDDGATMRAPPEDASSFASSLSSYRGASGRSLMSHSLPAARENRLASFIAPLGLGFGAGGVGGRSSMHGGARSSGQFAAGPGAGAGAGASPVLSPTSMRGSLTISSQISPPSTGGGSRARANSSAANLTPTHAGMIVGRPPLTPSAGSMALGSFVPRPPSEDRARSSSVAGAAGAGAGGGGGSSRPGSSAGADRDDLDSSFALGAAAFSRDRSRSSTGLLLTPTPPGSSGGLHRSGSSNSPAPCSSPLSAGMMGFAASASSAPSRASFASSSCSVASSPVAHQHGQQQQQHSQHPLSIGSARASPPSTAGELRPSTRSSSSCSSSARPATGELLPSACDADLAAPPSMLPVPPAASSSSDVDADRKCDNCDEHVAAVWCADCRMYLCTHEGSASCKQLIHRPAKMREHVIHLIGPIPA